MECVQAKFQCTGHMNINIKYIITKIILITIDIDRHAYLDISTFTCCHGDATTKYISSTGENQVT